MVQMGIIIKTHEVGIPVGYIPASLSSRLVVLLFFNYKYLRPLTWLDYTPQLIYSNFQYEITTKNDEYSQFSNILNILLSEVFSLLYS